MLPAENVTSAAEATSGAENGFYVIGGSLQRDARSYVERHADTELLARLRRGEFCYVLTSRQMGKSSLVVRTAVRLQEEGVAVVRLDLTAVGSNVTLEQWYDGLLRHMGRQLKLERELREFWRAQADLGPLQRWMEALRLVVLPHLRVEGSGLRVESADASAPSSTSSAQSSALNPQPSAQRLVIFIDEIDVIRSLPFCVDEFFAAIRECYNRRTEDAEFHRLTFCLLGVATPSDLIQDVRTTPFNIGWRIDLTDFSAEEAAPLADGFGREERIGKALLKRVLDWTGGHPYLTQRLCQAVAADATVTDPTGVDRLCEILFLSRGAQERDDNLIFVRERMLRAEPDLAGLLDLYGRVYRGQRVPDDEANRFVDTLQLSGIARSVDGILRVRNRIYKRVFGRPWIAVHMPDAERRRQRAAYLRGMLLAAGVSGVILTVIGWLAISANRSEATARRQRDKAVRAEQSEREQRQVAQRALVDAQRERDRAMLAEARAREQRQQAEQAKEGEREQRIRAQEAEGEALRSARTARDQAERAEAAVQNMQQARRSERRVFARRQAERGVRILEAGESGGLLDLLAARKLGDAAPEERRRWGVLWAAWHAVSAGRLRQMIGHNDRVRAVAFSPDGKLLVAAGDDQTAQLWEVSSGRPAGPPIQHRAPVRGVLFSPDGKLLVTAAIDGAVQLWERRPPAGLWRPRGSPLALQSGVETMAFSRDGRWLATGSKQGTARLWETTTGRAVGDRLQHGGEIKAVAFSPDGKLLATASDKGTVVFWNPTTGEPSGPPLEPDEAVMALAFSQDGKLLATAGKSGATQLWNPASRQRVSDPMPHPGAVHTVVFRPDGRQLVTVSRTAVRLWKTVTGKPDDQPLWHHKDVTAAALSPDGALLATASFDAARRLASIRLWETKAASLDAQLLPHEEPARSVAFSPDGQWLATASQATVQFWRRQGPSGAWQPHGRPRSHNGVIEAICFPPVGNLLATMGEDGRVRFWAPRRDGTQWEPLGAPPGPPPGRVLHTREAVPAAVARWSMTPLSAASPKTVWSSRRTADWSLLGQPWPEGAFFRPIQFPQTPDPFQQWRRTAPRRLAFSADGRRLAGVGEDGSVRLYDIGTALTRGRMRVRLLPDNRPATAVAFSADGKWLAAASRDGTAQIWETAAVKRHGPLLRHSEAVTAVAFSPNGRLLATASKDASAQLWETSTGQPHGPSLLHQDSVWEVLFSRDGSLVATASEDNSAQLWEANTGQPRGQPVRHRREISAIRFSPDGRLLATASRDGTVQLWETTAVLPDGPPLQHEGSVDAVAFSSKGELLATASRDQIVRLWRLPAPPARLREIELRTCVELGAESGPAGIQPITWQEWRRRREELRVSTAKEPTDRPHRGTANPLPPGRLSRAVRTVSP